MIEKEFNELKTDEGIVRFIVRRTGLDYDRVLRIYQLGQPWPLGTGEEWDFSRQADAAGVSIEECMVALAPLIEMAVEEKQAKLQEFEQAVSRGETIDPARMEEIEQALGNPVLTEHIEKVANLANEPIEIISQVFGGVCAALSRMNELIQQVIEEKKRRERDIGKL